MVSTASARRATPVTSADRKSTRLNSSHSQISYAVFCLKKKKAPNVLLCQAIPLRRRREHRGASGRLERPVDSTPPPRVDVPRGLGHSDADAFTYSHLW